MRLALINPPQRFIVDPCVYPPVGLGYLAAAVHRDCPSIECDLLDLAGHSQKSALEVIYPYDICGFTAVSPYWHDTVRLAEMNSRPGVRQIVGGAHTTITRERHPVFDTTFFGPAERSLVLYLQDVLQDREKPFYESMPSELDSLAFPEGGIGKKLNHQGADRTGVIFTGRGCTHKCAFCAARGLYPRVRLRSLDNVVTELRSIAAQGIRELRFMDDSFTMAKARVIEFCRRMSGMGFRWVSMARSDQIDQDILDAAVEAGCRGLAYGIESFDQAVLDALHKKTSVQQNMEAIQSTHDAGLNVHVFMLIGTPAETYKRTVDLNIAALEKLQHTFTRVLFSNLMPHPGCAIYNDPRAYGVRVVDRDYSKYNQHQYLKTPCGVMQRPAWSPIRIDGMTYTQQMSNLRRFHDYVFDLEQSNKGVLR